MPKLPNAETAILDIRKLSGYCLNTAHRRGRNKARVFQRALDIGQDDAAWLRGAILDALPDAEAVKDEANV
jgi:hypothetical protein